MLVGSGDSSVVSVRLVIERVRVLAVVGEFSSPGSAFSADTYLGICSTPMLHVKDPGHYAKSAGGRLQLNTYLCVFE